MAIARAENSPWEPRCITRIFSPLRSDEIALTMTGWAMLDAARSPLMIGGPLKTLAEVREAAAVFGMNVEGLELEDVARVVQTMEEAVSAAFATTLAMRPKDAGPSSGGNDGFGSFLPILSCLITQVRISLSEALALRVDRAHALIAGMRRNEGWECHGTAYALRELEEEMAAAENSKEGANA